MAWGKPPDPKAPLKFTPVVADQLWKANVHCEERAAESWQSKWGWILDEYAVMEKKIEELSRNSELISELGPKPRKEDTRNAKPFPSSENRRYGWIAGNEQFRLEKYGPDVYRGMRLLD